MTWNLCVCALSVSCYWPAQVSTQGSRNWWRWYAHPHIPTCTHPHIYTPTQVPSDYWRREDWSKKHASYNAVSSALLVIVTPCPPPPPRSLSQTHPESFQCDVPGSGQTSSLPMHFGKSLYTPSHPHTFTHSLTLHHHR